jgi:hypothetical protein
LRGEVDHLRGVSENIFLGLLPPMGTGVFDIFFEKKKHRGYLVSNIPRCALLKNSSENPKNPLSGINRILHLANLMAPTTTSKNFSTKMIFLKNNSPNEDGIPGASTCLEICSQINEFFPARLSGMFRPTSPVPFDECIVEEVFHSNEVDSCCFQSNEQINNENALMEKLFREHDIMSIYNAIPPSFFQ